MQFILNLGELNYGIYGFAVFGSCILGVLVFGLKYDPVVSTLICMTRK
jgi:hypothetical protein